MILQPPTTPAKKILLGHVDLTNEEYHGGPGISKSHLDVMERSPLHYWQAYINPEREPREATPAMLQGTLIHSAILEPDTFEDEYLVEPANAPYKRPTVTQLRAKNPSDETQLAILWWSEFDREAANKTIVTAEQWKIAMGARDSVYRHPVARKLLGQIKAEQSFFAIDPDTGALVKCRYDGLASSFQLDVKSTEDARPDAFARSVQDYRYHVQVPWYHDVTEAALDTEIPKLWYFLAVEKKPPYACALYTLPEDVYRAGRAAARMNLQRIVDCKALDVWPSYDTEPSELSFARWARARMGVDSPEAEFA